MLWIDTDAGIDDFVSLLILASKRDSIQILGISIVDGNVSTDKGIDAMAFLNEMIVSGDLKCKNNSQIPFYVGAQGPIIKDIHVKYRWSGHGEDGLGGISNLVEYKDRFVSPENQHAVNALLKVVNDYPGKVTVLALGPLTNIALAISLDHTFLEKVDRIIVMGGSLNAQGNSNRAAEFNFHYDPEAAHILFQGVSQLSRLLLHVVPWETCLNVSLDWNFLNHFSKSNLHLFQILQNITNLAKSKSLSRLEISQNSIDEYFAKFNGFFLPDVCATLIFLDHHSILESKSLELAVELNGTHSRGGLYADWIDEYKVSNCLVILKLDKTALQSLIKDVFF